MDWTSFFAQFLPPQKNAVWTPTYLPQQYVTEPNNVGGLSSQPLNILYFPDDASCEKLKQKYCPNGAIVKQAILSGGPVSAPQVPYLVFPNRVAIMAGMLTALWTQNPDHPDVADRLCLDAIAARGAAG
jgi:hypothetical protein